ncbi:MAG: CRISPR-associated helicase Cas3' [Gulosibacter sp.]|uniref:CRISPR-associated helicase Cas3' n=1 Tax=Gulosibacter sp. TaxID=2817531 RepID=UPI003F932EBB
MLDRELAPVSRIASKAWAKFDRTAFFADPSFPLYAHLQDTAAVASQLFDQWFSFSQIKLLAECFGTKETAHKITVWLAAAHDVGKATAAFAIKAPALESQMRDAGYVFPEPTPPAEEQRAFPHGLAGHHAVIRHLEPLATRGRRQRASLHIAEIVGGHHGAFPDTNAKIPFHFDQELGEDKSWHEVRKELLERADQIAGIDEDSWSQILDSVIHEPVQALLNGFLIVCDWIASNQTLFPYDRKTSASTRASKALRFLNFGDHWNPSPITDAGGYFQERFNISTPRPVQQDAVELANKLSEPSLMLIEAPTGEGKTEMAFACAEVFAANFGLQGAMVALPTRATSNAMFNRVLNWLQASMAGNSAVSVSLSHSKALFNERFQALFDRDGANETYDDDYRRDNQHAINANQWFLARKRNAFADFVVATIDQLLFMTLRAKHLSLRHLGYSGKVIIIDEVHAADDFMRTYLLRALQWLGAYGVPVIALSATLPPEQREELLHAYRQGARQGLDWDADIIITDDDDVDPEIIAFANEPTYPLVTAVGAETSHQISPARSSRSSSFGLEETADASVESIVSAVLSEADAGGCIAVVLDTVDRAQKVFDLLAEQYDGEIALFHSRFTVESRNHREQELVERLGPNSAERPKSMIIVATQVVESSLDVDFDMMFTDIAPIDALIQRIGRVHRHARPLAERPTTMQQPRVVLSGGIGMLTGTEPPEFNSGVLRVYGDSLLLRTLIALRLRNERSGDQKINIPEDVPGLIRTTYQPDLVPIPGWEDRLTSADEERAQKIHRQKEESRQFVIDPPGEGQIDGWSKRSLTEASEEARGGAQVRDAELSIEVVIVQEMNGSVYSLPWLPEQHASQPVDLIYGIEEDLAEAVATCTVSLPSWMTQGKGLDGVLDDLENNGIEAWQQSRWLKGMLPLILDEDFRTEINGHRLLYDQGLGLMIEKSDAK